MFQDAYYQIRIKPDRVLFPIFPHLLGDAYIGSFIEQGDSWILAVTDTHELDTFLRAIKELQTQYDIAYFIQQEPISNWNASWDENLKPIQIPPFLQVCRYTAQEEAGYEHTLYIEALNAFGTGHHSTTTNMLRLMQAYDFTSKKVLDLGCGTGILGILALKMGAEYVEFIDNDMKAIQNTIGNIARNLKGQSFSVVTGTLEVSRLKHYDIILANIYRNVLIENSALLMKKADDLFLSGYKVSTSHTLKEAFTNEDWGLIRSYEDDSWLAEHYTRIS